MTIAEFATKRVVATTMIIFFMIFAGYSAIKGMKQELLPDTNFPIAVVTTKWTGASPETVNTQITKKVEEAVLNVDGIKNISTVSALGTSVVVAEFNFGVDIESKKINMQSEIDKIKNDLPSDVDDPVVSEMDMSRGGSSDTVLFISLSGDDKELLTSFVENTLEPQLKRNRGIGSISIMGGSTKQIKVNIDPYKLKAFNLSPSELLNKIKVANTITPIGKVVDGGKEFILRVDGEITTLEDVQNIIITTNEGQTLKLKDVAEISYGVKDRETYTSINGKESIGIMIQKTRDGNVVEIAKTARKQLEKMKPLFPKGSDYEIITDNSTRVSEAIANVTSTGLQALVIAGIVLLIFLKDIRATIVISLSIPISVMFTFFLLNTQGISLNLVSLMGLALGVGSLVDNSVVTLDNIFAHMEEKKEPAHIAAVRGTNEVILPMIASTMTSVCVFLPIILKDGFTKEIFKGLSLSIMFSLAASIIVAILFVPMMSSKFLDLNKILKNSGKAKTFNKFKSNYQNVIRKALENKWKVVGGTVIAFLITIFGLFPFVKTAFFPSIDNKEYSVVAELSTGLDIQKSYEITKKLEEVVKKDKATKRYYTITQSDAAIVNVDVKDGTQKAIDRVREQVKDIPDVNISLALSHSSSSTAAKDYSFKITGDDETEINRIVNTMVSEMKKINWMKDVKATSQGGNPQAKLVVNREKAASYGVNVTNLTTSLNILVLGVDSIEINEGNEKFDVTLRLDEKYRDSLDKILDLEIKSENGTFVRIGDIAKIEQVEGASTITTEDGLKTVTVGLNLDPSKGFNDADKTIKEIFKKTNPASGYELGAAGNAETQKEMGGELMSALQMSIILIYVVLAVQLESFVLPLLIMSSLPLSIIGVVIGLVITRVQLSMFVMIGIIMLMGMVVNNAIILLDFVSMLREKGRTIKEALIEAGGSRLRAILMTTLTTVLGWIPMALAIGGGSAGYYQGMAIAVMFGLTFSTLLTLIFIPVLYLIVEERREKKLVKKLEKKEKKEKKEKNNK